MKKNTLAGVTVLFLVAGYAALPCAAASAEEEALYSEVLDEVQEMLISSEDIDLDRPMAGGLSEISMSKDADAALKSIGYAVTDISGDGIPELLIGALSDSGADVHPADYIVGCYTLKDGQPYPVFESTYRSRYSYIGEGLFGYEGAGGASNYYEGLYKITEDGTQLETEWVYFNELIGSCTSEEYVYYYNYTGSWDKEDSQELESDNTEFWHEVDKAHVTLEFIDMKPLSDR